MTEEFGHASCYFGRYLELKGDPEIEANKPAKRPRPFDDLFAADPEPTKAADGERDIATGALSEDILLDEERQKAKIFQQLSLLKRTEKLTFVAPNMSNAATSA